MNTKNDPGLIIKGFDADVRQAYARWADQPVDQEMMDEAPEHLPSPLLTSLAKPVRVTGPGTFLGRATRTLSFEPSPRKGWWIDRIDQPDTMPIRVSIHDVWTTARNIVLCTGSPHNYLRMVEHIIALRLGLGVDNLLIRSDSGDPPLFDRGSMDLVEAIEGAGLVTEPEPARYVTVSEPVTAAGPNGSFLTFLPAEGGSRELIMDCAVDFESAIGRQRIRFRVNRKTFRHGAFARTNTTLTRMLLARTIGKLFADLRNLGYTLDNILIAGPRRYLNAPRLLHNGRSLEAVWHRACLDLLAAIALIDRGRFAGTIISYKAGHTLDVQAIRELYMRDLLRSL